MPPVEDDFPNVPKPLPGGAVDGPQPHLKKFRIINRVVSLPKIWTASDGGRMSLRRVCGIEGLVVPAWELMFVCSAVVLPILLL